MSSLRSHQRTGRWMPRYVHFGFTPCSGSRRVFFSFPNCSTIWAKSQFFVSFVGFSSQKKRHWLQRFGVYPVCLEQPWGHMPIFGSRKASIFPKLFCLFGRNPSFLSRFSGSCPKKSDTDPDICVGVRLGEQEGRRKLPVESSRQLPHRRRYYGEAQDLWWGQDDGLGDEHCQEQNGLRSAHRWSDF